MKDRQLLTLAILAALIYNIWPLGYILNPKAMGSSYISLLQVSNQPYHLFFISTDIVSSLIMFYIGYLLFRKNRLSKGIIIGYILFGITTIIAAIYPDACTTNFAKCDMSANQVLSPDGITSIIGALTIFFILKTLAGQVTQTQKKLYNIIFLGWCASGLLLVAGVAFNVLAVNAQEVFLLLCGVAIVAIPLGKIPIHKET